MVKHISFIEGLYLKSIVLQDKINAFQIKLNEEQRKFNAQMCEFIKGTFDGKIDIDEVMDEIDNMLNEVK